MKMEKYMKPDFDIVELDEDVLTESNCPEEYCEDDPCDEETTEIEF
jgi:hypothetical protein